MFRIVLYLMRRKEVKEMAVIYATLIVKGKKTFAQVPARIQNQVKEILIDLEVPELAAE
ncbi:MAG: CD1375 family protein [Oscillospiraceae bacterium]